MVCAKQPLGVNQWIWSNCQTVYIVSSVIGYKPQIDMNPKLRYTYIQTHNKIQPDQINI